MIKFQEKYFRRYKEKNLFGLDRGERPFLYSFWMRKLKKLLPNEARVLDVGCCTGYFLRHIEKRFKAFGMDISKIAIREAKKKTRATLFVGNAEDLPFGNNSFKAIIAFDIVEHLGNCEAFFTQVHRVLNDSGYLIFSTPNPESLGSRLKPRMSNSQEDANDCRELTWFGWHETHVNIKTIKEWRDIMNSHGFNILKDGTDTLWDTPYFKRIPFILQKIIFQSAHWILSWIFGFFPWRYGENYYCVARKV